MINNFSTPDEIKKFNLLRAFPALFVVLTLIIYFLAYPIPNIKLLLYLEDVEEGQRFWGLYSITIPILIGIAPMFFLRRDLFKDNYYFHIAFCLTFPLAIALSIWLWEILGVVFMAFYFLAFCFMLTHKKIQGKEKEEVDYHFGYTIAYFLLFLAYCLVRLFSPHVGSLDVLVVAGYAVIVSFASIQTFWVKESKPGFFLSVPISVIIFYSIWYIFF